MSEQPDSVPVPEWDRADRMRKALREADIGVQEIAAYLDVSRNTVSTWINGRIKPSKQTLRLWAMKCGVSYDWLCHGDMNPCGPGHAKHVPAGQRGIMIPCSSPPAAFIFRTKTPRQYRPHTLPIDLPVAA